MQLNQKSCYFLCIDIQQRLFPHIHNNLMVAKNAGICNRIAQETGAPLLVVEQVPQAMGKTVEDVYVPGNTPVVAKSSFDALTPEVLRHVGGACQLVIYGIEAHICLTQTALSARQRQMEVFCVADAISSRSEDNRFWGLQRMQQAGCQIMTTEMLMFELLQTSEHPAFRSLSALIK